MDTHNMHILTRASVIIGHMLLCACSATNSGTEVREGGSIGGGSGAGGNADSGETPSDECAYPSTPPVVPSGVGASIDESVITSVLHVRTGAAPGGDGKPGSPFATLAPAFAAALRQLENGIATKISIGAGIYRESVGHLDFTAGKARDTLFVVEGAGSGATIWSGSDSYPASSWQDLGGGLWAHAWPYDFGFWAYSWEAPKILGHRAEMVFVNGEPLKQVILEEHTYSPGGTEWESTPGTWTYVRLVDPASTLRPGEFGVAERTENGNRLYLKLPANSTMKSANIEVAVRPQLAVFGEKNGLVIRGLSVQHAANQTRDLGRQTPLGFDGMSQNVLVEDAAFTWNNAYGFGVFGHRWTVRNSRFDYNGYSGAHSGEIRDSVLDDNSTSFNNWRGHAGGITGWFIAGIKLHRTHNVWLTRHRAFANLSPGVWFDVHCENVTITDLTSVLNGINLFLELSKGPFTVRRSLLANARARELYISIVGHYEVYDSLIFAGQQTESEAVEAVFSLRDDPHAQEQVITASENLFQGNVVMGGERLTAHALLYDHNGLPRDNPNYAAFRYRGKKNHFWATQPSPFQYKAVDWETRRVAWSGWGERNVESDTSYADPQLSDPMHYDFRPRPTSPLAARAGELPLRCIPEADIEASRRFFEWANADGWCCAP